MSFMDSVIFEQRFWMQVFGDHNIFFLDTLGPLENEDIKKAKVFKESYDKLYSEAQSLTNENVFKHLEEAKSITLQLRDFKLSIIRRQLNGEITINLPPTFINHMVNELEEYLNVMSYLEKGESPPIYHELHHHLVWLLDAAGHAQGINDSMDMVEQDVKIKSHEFVQRFKDFYIKAVEMAGYLRTNQHSFPALSKMNREVKLEIELFKAFLHEIVEMELNDEILGTFSAIMADHMAREECYYLIKLAGSTAAPIPECDPTKPRVQN